MKKIVILGASGFIGFNLLLYYSKIKNYKIIATYNLNNKRAKFQRKNITWVKVNLKNNSQKVKKILNNADIVFHCAAFSQGSKIILNKPLSLITENYLINNCILDVLTKVSIKKFIYFSCTVMYPNSKSTLTENQFDERKIFKNYRAGANIKLQMERTMEEFSKHLKTKFLAIRHSNIYGKYDKFGKEGSHVFATLIHKFLDKKQKKVEIFGDGSEKRDFLYIDDLLNAVRILEKNLNYKFDIFNVSYGKSFSIKELAYKIKNELKSNKTIKFKNEFKSLKVNILVSSKKIKKIYSWTPKVNLKKGILKTLKWYEENKKI